MRLAWLLAVAVLAAGSRAVDIQVGLLDRLRSKVATPLS